ARCASFGTGHGAVDPALDCGQFIDEVIGRRTATHPDDAIVGDMIYGGFRHQLLELLLVHAAHIRSKRASIAASPPWYKPGGPGRGRDGRAGHCYARSTIGRIA